MKRQYISVADQFAPFDAAYLSGLGAAQFPVGRSYLSTAHFRSPYDQGYYQDNDLMGFATDARVVLRQVPTWAYAVLGLGLTYLAYKKYSGKPTQS